MAQPGRSGHHDTNVNDTSQYVFNPMAYNYHSSQQVTPPTVLSQQDANLMADFFNNPDTASTADQQLAFGFEPKGDFTFGIPGHDGALDSDLSAGITIQPAHSLDNNHFLQTSRPSFQTFEQNPLQNPFLSAYAPQAQSGTDAVAGASALIGMSSSQEQQNLLNANSYMTWGTVVAASVAPASDRPNNFTSTPRQPPTKSSSTSQLQPHIHPPPTPNSWAEITNQALMQRARHPSLQLDTAASMYPNHQSAWQNAPQSAFPQGNKRSRPGMPTFGSDSRFSSHGFAGSRQQSPESKHANLMHMAGDIAMPHSAPPLDYSSGQHSFPHSHSIAGPLQHTQSAHSSPGNIGGLPTPANSVGAATSQAQARKRGLEDDADATGSPLVKPSNKRQKSNSQIDAAPTTTGEVAATSAPARGRRAAREQKAPRLNLTDEQKRNNHIASEQKRRDAMKTNFDILNRIVPALSNGAGLSRSEILQHTGDALESRKVGNETLARLIGIDMAELDEQPLSGDEGFASDSDTAG